MAQRHAPASGTVAVTMQHAEIGDPRTGGIAVLAGHDPGELVQVGEIMDCPRGEELRQRDAPQGRVFTSPVKVARLQIHSLQLCQILPAQLGKLIEESLQRFPAALFLLRQAVESCEGLPLAMLKDDPRSCHPVSLLTRNEVAHDIERTPGVCAFAAMNPELGQSAQE